MMGYYTYLLRCEDGSLYAGITNDLQHRMNAHSAGTGAKYTKTHRPLRLEAAWQSADRGTASKLEYQLKQLRKEKKEALLTAGRLEDFPDPTVYAPVAQEVIDQIILKTENDEKQKF